MRALQACCGTPWAITPAALTQILEIAARENLDVGAVEAQMGQRLDNSHAVTVRGGVATIPIDGPLFRHADLFTAISGATSIETLATDLHTAMDDPAVQAIVLAIDSPGGAVNGVGEFADMVYAARDVKPITAYVSHQGASAAYWIAAAASEVVVAPTAMVGSIGVVAAVPDPTKTRSRDIEFVSSQSPKKRPDPTTKKGSDQLQAMVDDLADLFIGAVATYRGVDPETVLAEFGGGDLFIGQKAVDAGLVDRVGTYEGVLADARAAAHRPRHTRIAAGSGVSTGRFGMAGFDWHNFFKAAKDEGVDLGATSEKDPVGLPGHPGDVGPSRLEALERENAQLKESMAREKSERETTAAHQRQAQADAFAESQIRASRALPEERDRLAKQALRALEADARSTYAAGEPTTMALLEQSMEARASHPLIRELLPNNQQVLTGSSEGVGGAGLSAADQAEKAAREYAEKQNRAEGHSRRGKD